MDWEKALADMNEVAEHCWGLFNRVPGTAPHGKLRHIHALVSRYEAGDRSESLYQDMLHVLTEDWWWQSR